MNNQLLQGSQLTDTLLTFPVTWGNNGREMVKARNMTQADIRAIEAKLFAFRQRRAEHRIGVFMVTIAEATNEATAA